MNDLFLIFIIAVFIMLFYRNDRDRLRYVIADGMTVTAALICSCAVMSIISFFGDLGVFKIPMSALACAGVYSLLSEFVMKEKAVGLALPTAMILFLTMFDYSIIMSIFYGLLLTVMMTVLYTIRMRADIHTGKALSGAPIMLCSAGLIAMIIDAIK